MVVMMGYNTTALVSNIGNRYVKSLSNFLTEGYVNNNLLGCFVSTLSNLSKRTSTTPLRKLGHVRNL